MRFYLLILTILCLNLVQTADAQMFGRRSIGRARVQSPATRGPAAVQPGVLTGTRRFMRGQRRRNDFVGSDRTDMDGFVGSTAGRTQGTVTSSTTGLREQPTAQVNDAMTTPPRRGPYAPRITLSASVGLTGSSQAAQQIALSLNSTLQRLEAPHGQTNTRPPGPIRVTVKNRTAILSGVVATEHDRQVAGLLASFEPGVEEIENQLRVTGQVQPFPLATPNR